VAAGLAWYIAHTLLGHSQPFFAPTAAALSLSKNRVLRGQHALQLIAGVVLGIACGTVIKALAGPAQGAFGAVAITAAVAIALVAALVLGGGFLEQGVLFVNQSASSAILMIAVAGTATAAGRLSDALIGAGVTLTMTVLVFPADPLPLIRDAVRQVFGALRDTLEHLAEVADAAEPPGPEWALAVGQRIHRDLADLDDAQATARQVARLAPRRWPQRSRVHRAAEHSALLHLLAASVLSLAHASTAASAVPQPRSAKTRQALHELTSAFSGLAEGDDPTQAAAHAIQAWALMTGTAQSGSARTGDPHAELIAGLVETCADDTRQFCATHGVAPLPG
jgi:uncharacterized membrane protein YgaE (UPF0421/DUF939 family)